MSNEEWRAYHNYADEILIQVRVLDEERKELDTSWVVVAHGSTLDRDWLHQQVEALGRSPESGDSVFHLDIRESHTSWGGDAASLQMILDISKWVLTAAFGAAINQLMAGMAARNSGRNQGPPLDEQEAIERASWFVARRFKLPSDSLALTSVEVEPPDVARVSLRGSSGETYDVELRREQGLVYAAKIKRTLAT